MDLVHLIRLRFGNSSQGIVAVYRNALHGCWRDNLDFGEMALKSLEIEFKLLRRAIVHRRNYQSIGRAEIRCSRFAQPYIDPSQLSDIVWHNGRWN